MPAYLVYICKKIHDRSQLEIYWQKIGPTLQGYSAKMHAAYTRFQVLEGGDAIEGVVIAEFPSMERAREWYDSPAYAAIRHHRMQGADYLGVLVEGGMAPAEERMLPR
jgi:uncharacterized protein (DUF1330 family)